MIRIYYKPYRGEILWHSCSILEALNHITAAISIDFLWIEHGDYKYSVEEFYEKYQHLI